MQQEDGFCATLRSCTLHTVRMGGHHFGQRPGTTAWWDRWVERGGGLLPAMAQSSAWHSIVTMQKVFRLVGAPEARPIVGKTNYRVLVQQTNPTHHGLSRCNNRTIACDSHSDTHSSKESTLKTTIFASSCWSYLKSKMYQLPPNKTGVLDIFPLSIAH